MTKTKLMTGAMVTILLLGSVSAYAAGQGRGGDGPRGGGVNFERLDLNGDGSVTVAELEGQGAARFAEIDADGDGMATVEELIKSAELRRSQRLVDRATRLIERADTDGDGMISQAEMEAAQEDRGRRGEPGARFFRLFDDNEDGVVTKDEFETARAVLLERRGGTGDDN
ncbi:MAG: EF-hand domain-containing protein [Dinoroseobacter sp.]|nr:EF-hand domain-containing protein [Dinoroseobacter sp.]